MLKSRLAAAAAATLLLTVGSGAGAKSKDPNKLVCKGRGDTTSRIARVRTCHTQAEWDAEEEARRRDAERGLQDTNHQREQLDRFRNSVGENGQLPRA